MSKRFVTITLTELEHRKLMTLTGEGFEGIMRDEDAAKGFIGGKIARAAAVSAFQKLSDAKPGPAPIWLTAAERAALREACGNLDAGPNEMTEHQQTVFKSAWGKL